MQTLVRNLNALYHLLVDLSADAVVLAKCNGEIVHISESAETLLHCKASKAIGQPLSHLFDSGREELNTLINEVAASQQQFLLTEPTYVNIDADPSKPIHVFVGTTSVRDSRYIMLVCRQPDVPDSKGPDDNEIAALHSALFDAAVDGIVTIDEKGVILSFNKAAESMFGYTREEILGHNVSMLMPGPYAESHDGYLSNYLRTGDAKIIGVGRDVPGKHKSGTIFPMRLSVGEAESASGSRFIGICHDLTDYQSALIQLSRAEQRYKSIVESQSQMICRLDQHKKITFVNRAFQSTFDCSFREVIGLNFINLVLEWEGIPELFKNLDKDVNGGELHTRLMMQSKKRRFPAEWWFRRVRSEDEDFEYQAFGIDVSDKELAIAQADFLKTCDPLTGLLNREEITRRFEKWIDEGETYIVLLTDFNHFQLINHTYGFHAANQLLIDAGNRLSETLGSHSLIARVRADQFMIITRSTDEEDGMAVASCVKRNLESQYRVGKDVIELSARCGVSLYPVDSADVEELFKLSETAVRSARERTTQISFCDLDLQNQMKRTLKIEQALKQAVQNQQIKVYLQPKVACNTTEITGFEALARWQSDTLGFIPPNEFIAVAENMNFSLELDRYIIDQTLSLMGHAIANGAVGRPVAINVCSRFFLEPKTLSYLESRADRYHVPLTLIQLEITERLLLQVNHDVTRSIQSLRNAGIKISIDDFGTGYSSLSYLKDLRVDELKIDKSFIDGLTEPYGRALVDAIVKIAVAGKLSVVAEGVETKSQLDELRGLQCQQAQGYFFARPGPFEEVYYQTNSRL